MVEPRHGNLGSLYGVWGFYDSPHSGDQKADFVRAGQDLSWQ